jgi:hypothetical protein
VYPPNPWDVPCSYLQELRLCQPRHNQGSEATAHLKEVSIHAFSMPCYLSRVLQVGGYPELWTALKFLPPNECFDIDNSSLCKCAVIHDHLRQYNETQSPHAPQFSQYGVPTITQNSLSLPAPHPESLPNSSWQTQRETDFTATSSLAWHRNGLPMNACVGHLHS